MGLRSGQVLTSTVLSCFLRTKVPRSSAPQRGFQPAGMGDVGRVTPFPDAKPLRLPAVLWDESRALEHRPTASCGPRQQFSLWPHLESLSETLSRTLSKNPYKSTKEFDKVSD